MNNFHIYEEIGRGKYSTVYKGRKKKSLDYFAVKSVEKPRKYKVMNEVRVFHNMNHPHILKFDSWYETRNHIWLIVEYCPGGDLLKLIEQDKSLPESEIKSISTQIIQGLLYLHTSGFILADLKPANILFDEEGRMKISDFGLAKKVSDASEGVKRGTPFYMAPELFEENGSYSYQSDMWSLGCLLYELACGRPPFVSTSFTELVNQIQNEEVPCVLGFSDPFNDFLRNLLRKVPSDRPTWEECIRHPWINLGSLRLELPQEKKIERRHVKKNDVVRMSSNAINNILKEKNSYKTQEDSELKINNTNQVLDFTEEGNENVAEENLMATQLLSKPTKENKVEELIFHKSDLSVKPIIPSKDSNKDTSSVNLGFEPLTKDNVDSFLSNIYTLLSKPMPSLERLNLLGYFDSVINSSSVANKIINSKFIHLLVKLLASAKRPQIKLKILSIVGQTIRFSTIIESKILKTGLMTRLCEEIRDKNDQIRRKAMASLGELIFFITTQSEDSDWELPSGIVSVLVRNLKSEDEHIRFYAARTVENITSSSNLISKKLCINEVVILLIDFLLLTSHGTFKRTAVACLHNILRLSNDLASAVGARLPFNIFESLVKEPDNKLLQASLTLLALLVKDGNYQMSNELVGEVCRFTNASSMTVKAKSLLVLGLSIKRNIETLPMINRKVWVNVEKLRKDNYNYIHQSLKFLKDCLREAVYHCIATVRFLDEASCIFPLIKDQVDWHSLTELLVDSVPSHEFSLFQVLDNLGENIAGVSQSILEKLVAVLIAQLNSSSEKLRFLVLNSFHSVIMPMLVEPSFDLQSLNLLIKSHFFEHLEGLLNDKEPILLLSLKLIYGLIEHMPSSIEHLNCCLFIRCFEKHPLNAYILDILLKLFRSDLINLEAVKESKLIEKLANGIVYGIEQNWKVEDLLEIQNKLLNLAKSSPNYISVLYMTEPLFECFPAQVELLFKSDRMKESAKQSILGIIDIYRPYVNSIFYQRKFFCNDNLSAFARILASGEPELTREVVMIITSHVDRKDLSSLRMVKSNDKLVNQLKSLQSTNEDIDRILLCLES